MAEKEIPVGCRPILGKLSGDLRDDVDPSIISEDLENFKRCLKANDNEKP